jgi:hypothetical protein
MVGKVALTQVREEALKWWLVWAWLAGYKGGKGTGRGEAKRGAPLPPSHMSPVVFQQHHDHDHSGYASKQTCLDS